MTRVWDGSCLPLTVEGVDYQCRRYAAAMEQAQLQDARARATREGIRRGQERQPAGQAQIEPGPTERR